MVNIRVWPALLMALPILTGFTWPIGSEPCQKALELATGLEQVQDPAVKRQNEAKIVEICPDGAAAHYVSALQFERVGNADAAVTEYRKALKIDRSFGRASGNLGLIYLQKGMTDEASVELSRGLGSVPDARYHKAMAEIMAERKVYALARYHYGEALQSLERDPALYTGLAEVNLAAGQHDRAMEDFRRALTLEPASERASIGIAAILLARDEQDKALEQLKAASAANPQNRDIHLMMAGIYEKKGDQKQADAEYRLGGKPRPAAEPKPVQATPPPTEQEQIIESLKSQTREQAEAVSAYEKLGNLYLSAGKESEAMTAYREAAHLNSPVSDVYLNLGVLYEKNNQLDEAVVAYKQAVRLKGDNAEARLRLADIRNARGFYQEAVEQYAEYLKIKPESPAVQVKLARLLTRARENNQAIDAYTAALKYAPDNLDAHREVAALYKAKGETEKAIGHYRSVLERDKKDADTRGSLVSLYVKDKRYDEITALLKEAVELAPEDPNNHYKLGLIYDFKKDYDNAMASYKKGIELKPDHARSLNALGRLYMKTGRLSEARETLELAKKADPSMEEASVLLNNIKDEFNPEPRKIVNKKSKSKKGKKGSKSSKGSKASKSKTAKSTKKAPAKKSQ